MSSIIWRAIPLGVLSLVVTWWFARRISLPLWQLARNVQDGEDTGNAISHVNGIRAWYFEVAQLKQAVLYSFNALQDRIGTLNRASRTDPLTGCLNRRGLQHKLSLVSDEAGGERADADASHQIPDQRRQAQLVGQRAEDEGEPEANGIDDARNNILAL